MNKIDETVAPSGAKFITETGEDGRVLRSARVDPNGSTITLEFTRSAPAASAAPLTETARSAVAAMEATDAARRRRTVKEAVDKIVERVEDAGSDAELESATGDAYGLFFASRNPTWAAAVARGQEVSK